MDTALGGLGVREGGGGVDAGEKLRVELVYKLGDGLLRKVALEANHGGDLPTQGARGSSSGGPVSAWMT